MKRPLLLLLSALLPLTLALASRSATAQSTGMGIVLPDPTPRERDPRDVLRADQPSITAPRKLQESRARRQAQVLAECNQILILSHQLHLKLLQPDKTPALPTRSAMTRQIADLARKVQQDMQSQ